jgi:hypothetical protein
VSGGQSRSACREGVVGRVPAENSLTDLDTCASLVRKPLRRQEPQPGAASCAYGILGPRFPVWVAK